MPDACEELYIYDIESAAYGVVCMKTRKSEVRAFYDVSCLLHVR